MLGIVLALLAALCYGSAAAIQKHSMGSFEKFDVKGMIQHKTWLLSMIISVAGVSLYLVSLSVGEITEIQPMLSLSLVVPIMAGVTFFKEKLTVRRWLSVALIIAGMVMVSI